VPPAHTVNADKSNAPSRCVFGFVSRIGQVVKSFFFVWSSRSLSGGQLRRRLSTNCQCRSVGQLPVSVIGYRIGRRSVIGYRIGHRLSMSVIGYRIGRRSVIGYRIGRRCRCRLSNRIAVEVRQWGSVGYQSGGTFFWTRAPAALGPSTRREDSGSDKPLEHSNRPVVENYRNSF
jgi:hypothetical protein